MDKILRELKGIREKTEFRFRGLLDELDDQRKRLRSGAGRLRDALGALPDGTSEPVRAALEEVLQLQEGYLRSQELLIEGLRESMALDNARSAELARQLTVLPLERMDLVLDEFERRLEAQECELQRLRKKTGGSRKRKS